MRLRVDRVQTAMNDWISERKVACFLFRSVTISFSRGILIHTVISSFHVM
jgi:hypothetical protein